TNEEPQHVPREEGQRATPMVTSRVLKEEEIASPVELAKAYMASRPYKVAPVVELAKAYMVSRPYKLPAEPPHKKPAFRTSVPGRDSALAADIVATSTLPGVSRTPAVVEPPQKKCAFQMSAHEDDSFEIDDALAEPKALESTKLENYTCFMFVAPLIRINMDCKSNTVENENDQKSRNIFGEGNDQKSVKLIESGRDQQPTNIFGKSESKDGKGNDQKAANVCRNLDAPASTAPTNGILSFGTTTSSLFNFCSPHVSSTSIASIDTATTVISTTTTPTPAAILSTSTPTTVIPSSVPASVFSFWSATSTTPTISEAETGNTSVRNDKDLKSNSPFASTPISTTTTTTGSGLFGFSSPAVTSTTNNQSQASFFNVSNGSQANTQASVAVTPFMPFLFGSGATSIPSSASETSPFSSPASTSSSFCVSSIIASKSPSGPATSIFWSTWDPEGAYRFGTTYNDHTSTKSMEEDSMQTSTPVFDMSVVAEDTHVHGTDMSVDSMVAEDTHVHGTDMSVDSIVAEDTHVHGTDISVDNMVAEDTHVHGTGAILNNYDHTHMDMMVEDCMQTPTGETSVASPLFSFDSSTQPPFSSLALHLDRTRYCLHLQMPEICVALGSRHFVFLQSKTPSLLHDLNEFLKDTPYLEGIELNARNRSAAKECYLRTELCLEGLQQFQCYGLEYLYLQSNLIEGIDSTLLWKYPIAVRSLEKGDLPRLLSYPLNETPLKLPAEPPQKKRTFWTSVPGSDLALEADIMSAPEDDSFEIDDALAADIVATSTLSGVSLTPALVENKQMFPEVVKVLEQAEPKALKLTRLG
nr:hypothetical protein [Tanacetum cinerariifolium]